MDINNISGFLASRWFKEASRRALRGLYEPAVLIIKPSEGGQNWHPIITWTPDEYEGWKVWGQIPMNLSERQASAVIHDRLRTAPIL